MRANEDMMPKLSICHGHGSKMNFSVSDYIRGDTAYLSLHHLQGVQVQSEPFISSIAFVPLVVRGCNINFLIQKGGENDAQLLKL